MTMRCGCCGLAILAIFIATTSCSRRSELQDGKPIVVHVDVDEEKVDVVDHYLEIDRRALIGVDKASADKALAGDGAVALVIGNAFADANHITESRFWYRIAAENGDAIGMSNFSIAVSELDCRRSIYWLKRAVDQNELSARTQATMQKELERAISGCK